MVEFVAQKRIPVKTNIYHSLYDIPKLVNDVHSGRMKGKAVVVIDHTQVK